MPDELPKLTLKNVALDVVHGVKAVIVDPEVSKVVAPVCFLLENLILKVIIFKVPYTEIDFQTYLQQVSLVKAGELDYSKIYGDSGKIVYPAGFVKLYSFLHWLSESGSNLYIAQRFFSYVYLLTLVTTVCCYFMAGGYSKGVPPWCFWLLILSKRLHSIYVLRMFNDCFTTLFMVACIALLQQACKWKGKNSRVSQLLTMTASCLFSLAVSVKMNALLYLPGFLLVLYLLRDENLLKCIPPIASAMIVQILIGWDFIQPSQSDSESVRIRSAYLNQAFDFKRTFLYEWTVNWRFLSEDKFLSSQFHTLLLTASALIFLVFVVTRFITKPTVGKSLTEFVLDGLKFWKSTSRASCIVNDPKAGPQFVFLVMSISNLIGVLFSRSLHYQFLSWYVYSLPYLLWRSGFGVFSGSLVFALHELCWNVFPSTEWSSILLVTILAGVLFRIWKSETLFVAVKQKQQ